LDDLEDCTMARKSTAAAVAVAASLALSACAGGASADDAAATDTINAELWYAPSTFDPAKASASADVTVARLGFDTLLRQGESEGYIGGLASDWTAVSASEYEFTLRDDATCADGTAITPSVVADSFEYLVGLDDPGAQTWKNQAFGPGKPTFTPDDDAGTLAVALSEPYSQLLGGVTRPGTGIICPAGLEDPEGLAAGSVDGAWSGPYTLSDVAAGVSASYALREDYDQWPAWENVEGEPAATINLTVQSDSNTSANLLASGGVDVARFYDSNALRFEEDPAYSTVTFASSAYNLVFNQAPGAGSVFEGDQELRTAVAQAIDPQGFNDAGLDGLGVAQYTVNAASYVCALEEPELLQEYDAAAAAEALDGQTIRLLIMSNWDPAADFLAESLRAAGATVEVSAPDPADWTTQMRTEPKTWDLAVAAENAETGLIHTSIARYLGATYPDGGTNVVSSDNPEGVDLYEAGMAADDPETQCENFLAAQRTVLERVDMVPLITDTHRYVAREGFATYVFSGYWDISAMRIL
jgi:ABC-type transport system substrate-binding protein